MPKVDFIFLHGFLGLPADWEDVIDNIKVDLEEVGIEGEFHILDYFNHPSTGPKHSLDIAATEMASWISASTFNPKKILVGYSLGGRLALHIFEKNPDLFHRLICVSANPGYKSVQTDQKKERDSRDHFWAELFLHHNWPDVVQKWNEQEVFQGSSVEPERDASQFRRDLLSKSLVSWSLAKQEDKRPMIQKHVNKISWVAGEKDKKFAETTRGMIKDIPKIEIEIIPQAGHRILFDNSFDLAKAISSKAIK